MKNRIRLTLAITLFVIGLSSANAQVTYYPDISSRNFAGLCLYDNDSTFSCNFRFRIQNRVGLVFNDRMDLTNTEFIIRRLRLRLNGFIVNKRLTYAIQLGFSRADMDWDVTNFPNIIRDAMISYKVDKHLMVSIGQGKLPGNRERIISSGELQLVDRSIANARFTLDRDFGVQALYENNIGKAVYTLRGALSSGKGRNWNLSNDGMCYTAKAEIKPFGKFEMDGDYFEGDWVRESSPKLALAAAYSYNQKALRTGGQLGHILYEARDMQSFFVDMMYKHKGWAFMGEYMARKMTNPYTYTTDRSDSPYAYNGQGYNATLSYQFPSHWEIASRFPG